MLVNMKVSWKEILYSNIFGICIRDIMLFLSYFFLLLSILWFKIYIKLVFDKKERSKCWLRSQMYLLRFWGSKCGHIIGHNNTLNNDSRTEQFL